MDNLPRADGHGMLTYGIAATGLGLALLFKKTPWTAFGKSNARAALNTCDHIANDPKNADTIRHAGWKVSEYARLQERHNGALPSRCRLFLRFQYEVIRIGLEAWKVFEEEKKFLKSPLRAAGKGGTTGSLAWWSSLRRWSEERSRSAPLGDYDETDSLLVVTNFRKDDWILDSGAQGHAVDDRCHFINYTKWYWGPWFCQGIGGYRLMIMGRGDVEVNLVTGSGESRTVIIKDVYHCPGMGGNVISFAQLRKEGHSITLTESGFICKTKSGAEMVFLEDKGLFKLERPTVSPTEVD